MKEKDLPKPAISPRRILALRESAFAADLFIAAASHFDFFNKLENSPAGIDTICATLGIRKRPADVMLTLFKAYGFVKENRGIYSLTDTATQFLAGSSPYSLSSYVASLKDRPIVADVVKVLQTGQTANWAAEKDGQAWATAMADDAFAQSFTAGMNSRGAYLAGGLVKALDLQGSRSILDIGGGSGIYTIVLLENNPGLRGGIFEKPPVDRVAAYSVKQRNLEDRISIIPGDMFRDRLPGGYDVHLLSHVLHDWDFNEVRAILKNSYASMEPGGKIVLHDAHINRGKTGPVSVAEYSVLLMLLSEGKCYSVKEMEETLEDTGFKNVEYKPTIYNRSIITATR